MRERPDQAHQPVESPALPVLDRLGREFLGLLSAVAKQEPGAAVSAFPGIESQQRQEPHFEKTGAPHTNKFLTTAVGTMHRNQSFLALARSALFRRRTPLLQQYFGFPPVKFWQAE